MKNNPFFGYINSFLKEKLNPKDPDVLSDLGSSFLFPFQFRSVFVRFLFSQTLRFADT